MHDWPDPGSPAIVAAAGVFALAVVRAAAPSAATGDRGRRRSGDRRRRVRSWSTASSTERSGSRRRHQRVRAARTGRRRRPDISRPTRASPSTHDALYVARARLRHRTRAHRRHAHAARSAIAVRLDPQVVVDSYFDRRSAYEFGVNPVGVKTDRYYFNDGNSDDSWDAVWDVEVARDAEGWTRGVPHSVLAAALQQHRGRPGRLCRHSRDRAAGGNVDVAAAVAQRQRVRVAVRRSARPADGRRAEEASSCCRTRVGSVATQTGETTTRWSQRTDPGGVGRPRPEVRGAPGLDADGHGQSGLRPGRSRSGRRQPRRVRDVLPGAAAVLRRGLGHVPVQHRLQRRRVHRPVLLAAHRPRAAGVGDDRRTTNTRARPISATILGAASSPVASASSRSARLTAVTARGRRDDRRRDAAATAARWSSR